MRSPSAMDCKFSVESGDGRTVHQDPFQLGRLAKSRVWETWCSGSGTPEALEVTKSGMSGGRKSIDSQVRMGTRLMRICADSLPRYSVEVRLRRRGHALVLRDAAGEQYWRHYAVGGGCAGGAGRVRTRRLDRDAGPGDTNQHYVGADLDRGDAGCQFRADRGCAVAWGLAGLPDGVGTRAHTHGIVDRGACGRRSSGLEHLDRAGFDRRNDLCRRHERHASEPHDQSHRNYPVHRRIERQRQPERRASRAVPARSDRYASLNQFVGVAVSTVVLLSSLAAGDESNARISR
jgi:hypothetical protein